MSDHADTIRQALRRDRVQDSESPSTASSPGPAVLDTTPPGGKIVCPRCEGQRYDVGSCGLCRNIGWLDENGEPLDTTPAPNEPGAVAGPRKPLTEAEGLKARPGSLSADTTPEVNDEPTAPRQVEPLSCATCYEADHAR